MKGAVSEKGDKPSMRFFTNTWLSLLRRFVFRALVKALESGSASNSVFRSLDSK